MGLYTSFAVDAEAEVVVDLSNGSEEYPATLRFGQVSMALTAEQLQNLRWQAETAWAELDAPDGDDEAGGSIDEAATTAVTITGIVPSTPYEVPDGWGMADPEKNSDL